MVASDEVFSKVDARLAKVDPAKQQITSNFKFNVTDDSGAVLKTWFLDLKAIKLVVGDGTADCTWTVSDKVMCDIGSGAISIKDAISQGKLTIDGSADLAEKLEPFVSSL